MDFFFWAGFLTPASVRLNVASLAPADEAAEGEAEPGEPDADVTTAGGILRLVGRDWISEVSGSRQKMGSKSEVRSCSTFWWSESVYRAR